MLQIQEVRRITQKGVSRMKEKRGERTMDDPT
jgi:hypothetical protein